MALPLLPIRYFFFPFSYNIFSLSPHPQHLRSPHPCQGPDPAPLLPARTEATPAPLLRLSLRLRLLHTRQRRQRVRSETICAIHCRYISFSNLGFQFMRQSLINQDNNCIVICDIHILCNSKRREIKLGQRSYSDRNSVTSCWSFRATRSSFGALELFV
ncbi:hypothetical protein ACMD2_17645, partial [Ananas comosus]